MERLKEIKDPVDGSPLNIRIYKKEEVYDGPYIDQAADLFVDLKGCEYVMQKEIYAKEVFGPAKTHSGTHRHEGIFIVKGEGVKKKLFCKRCKNNRCYSNYSLQFGNPCS